MNTEGPLRHGAVALIEPYSLYFVDPMFLYRSSNLALVRRRDLGPWRRSFVAVLKCLQSKSTDRGARGESDAADESKEISQKTSDADNNALFEVRSLSSKAAPASMDAGIAKLMKKNMKPYIPKTKHQRLSYEYPGLPNEDDFTKHTDKMKKQRQVSRWSLVLPKIAVFGAVLWGAYVVKVWLYGSEDDADSTELLDPDIFHKFIITHKQQVDEDHYLVEVRPKYNNWQYSYYAHYASKSIWNGDRMWSVEIKQPDILVVRSYTPLPLYFMKSELTRAGKKEPLLRVVENDCEDHDKGGVMTFYIKRYGDGEVSRFIVDKNIGDELELRGPHVEYKFPHHPFNALHERPIFRDLPSKVEPELHVASLKKEHGVPDYDTLDFYGAGTGIAPILQVLFSRNPYRGFVNVHYSARSTSELGPLLRYLFFLEKLDRIKWISHYDGVLGLAVKDITPPRERNYISDMRRESELAITPGSEEEKLKLRMALLNGDSPREKTMASPSVERSPWYETALHQARVTAMQKKPDAALALVCGPDGYVDFVAGGKVLATNEQGPVQGLLGANGWNETNVYKL